MGREVRRVPAHWQHPTEDGSYIPLFDGYERYVRLKAEEAIQWNRGYMMEYDRDFKIRWVLKSEAALASSFDEWDGAFRPPEDYMPDWPQSERTHYQMYETTSEGKPISPIFASAEELAHWLAENNADSFGNIATSYENWLRMITGKGSSVSMALRDNGWQSGVEAGI